MTTKTNPLLDAADYIQDNGWCRNSFLDNKGRVCLAGAVGRVTGAILPLTARELQNEIRTYVKEFDYTPEDAAKEVTRFKWSKSQAKLRTYAKALTALATEIDAAQVTEAQDAYTQPETYTWVSDPNERQARADQSLRNRVEGIVISRNDDTVHTDKGVVRNRTTKAQAVALLKRAAKRI